jgi:hypothetical protein
MKWHYYKYSSLGPEDVYRCPDNGKTLFEQSIADVEVYKADGTWRGHQRQVLWEESCKGWFSEKQDEIPEEEALSRMAKIMARAKGESVDDDQSAQ